jgi:hypothetical protein
MHAHTASIFSYPQTAVHAQPAPSCCYPQPSAPMYPPLAQFTQHYSHQIQFPLAQEALMTHATTHHHSQQDSHDLATTLRCIADNITGRQKSPTRGIRLRVRSPTAHQSSRTRLQEVTGNHMTLSYYHWFIHSSIWLLLSEPRDLQLRLTEKESAHVTHLANAFPNSNPEAWSRDTIDVRPLYLKSYVFTNNFSNLSTSAMPPWPYWQTFHI